MVQMEEKHYMGLKGRAFNCVNCDKTLSPTVWYNCVLLRSETCRSWCVLSQP